ncbi:MAG: hypothetical protein COB66_05680 [Coxiella sp. (in: Bacteria)]|nr:MAG: hypothetical protein COB66_05680 [Coxiella sp. (in: g-proteobacteria)]
MRDTNRQQHHAGALSSSATLKGAFFTKLHCEKMLKSVLDAAAQAHFNIGKQLELFCHEFPPMLIMVEGLGNVAAGIKFRHTLSLSEKRALGLRVTTGLIALGVSIAAFALPHFSAALILTGISSNLVYSYFNVFKLHREKRELEEQRDALSANDTDQCHDLTHKITETKQELAKLKIKLKSKAIELASSSIVLIGLIAVMANPVTALPVSIILATTSVAYGCYHYRKPILSVIKRVGDKIRNLFKRTPQPQPKHANNQTALFALPSKPDIEAFGRMPLTAMINNNLLDQMSLIFAN